MDPFTSSFVVPQIRPTLVQRRQVGKGPLAARIGRQAVGIAAETGSARIFSQLDRLDQALAPAVEEDDVAEFRASPDRIVLHPG
ncbi:hypothetical protein [Streptomyces sp. NPDC092952]|uniref:hypothetical protein n=1 Tax=Streptomyces sp. NPDC092952 TaxID=3366018 RepID=UPI00382EF407